MTLTAPDEADAWLIDHLDRRIEQAPEDPRVRWQNAARPEQIMPPVGEDWRVMYFQGGRGSGKTRAGAGAMADLILSDDEPEGAQYGIVAPTYRDAWTVCVEGESGILQALGTTAGEVKNGTSRLVEYAYRSYGEIGMRNGIVIYVDSADDGALRVQGKNLKAAWCAEIGLWARWATAWNESVKYAVRKGYSKIICDGTPKASRPARELIRRLLRGEEPNVVIRRLRTVDNIRNLSKSFYDSVVGAAKGTRLERQELEGELLDDVANALWTRDLLDEIQVPAVGQPGAPHRLWNCVIGVDPSDGAEDSDEQAYTVTGKGPPDDHHLYVAENWGGQMAPAPFARRVILKAIEWDAQIVVEKNHGGAWLSSTFALVMKEMRREGLVPDGRVPIVRTIHASQAKRTRAEPISAMYYRRSDDGLPMVRHCKMASRDREGNIDVQGMVELEDQMATFTGAQGERSPDRLDSLVWSMDPFRNVTFGPAQPAGKREWAAQEGELLEAAGGDLGLPEDRQPSRADRRLAEAHGGLLDRQAGDWSLDGFGPQDDKAEPQRTGPRRNVKAWR